MSATYDLAGVLPDEALGSLPRGSNVVIVGPSMSGKRELAIQLLAAGFDDNEGILTITTDGTVGPEDFERHLPTLDRNRVSILDCSGSGDGGDGIRVGSQVSSPGDLTGISISMAKQLKTFEKENVEGIRYGLVSISTLLLFLDVQTVFKFLHVYTNRVESTGGLGIFTLSDDSHDPQTTNTILGQFDTVIRLRETESGEREIQVRGGGAAPTAWLPFAYGRNAA